MRKNNISFTNTISKKNFRRFKRFPHPFVDDRIDPEKPMIPYKFANRRDGDVEKLVADTSKILKHIDWKPKYNDLKEIINSSVNWEKKINASNT